MHQIAAWGAANAMKQHIEMTNARASQITGSRIDPIPFGNVTNISADQSGSTQPPQKSFGLLGPLLGAGLGGGLVAAGLGLAKTLMPAAAIPAPPAPPAIQSAEETIPLIIDWELNDARSELRASTGTGPVGP
jgi:hypothetical protein